MIRATQAFSIVLAAAAFAAACASDPEVDAPPSPCVAFPKAGPPQLRIDGAAAPKRSAALLRITSGAGRAYALDREGGLGRVDADAAAILPVGTGTLDFAVSKDGAGVVRVFVARFRTLPGDATATFELVRFVSEDGGLGFAAASEKILLSVPGVPPTAGQFATLGFARDGLLYLALGDADLAPGGAPSLLGKVLRLDVSGDAAAAPPDNPFASGGGLAEAWAAGVHQPRGLDVDTETGDVWLTDFSPKDDATLVHRIVRGGGEALQPALVLPAADKRAAFAGGHVYRGKAAPSLVGRYVYPASNGALVVVDRFGPSGPPLETKLRVGEDGPIGRGDGGELLMATAKGVGRVVDGGPASPAPTSLLATSCWDPTAPAGVPVGAVPYEVASALWSDGAVKDRFVVVPKGTKITARPGGDLVFPVGTVTAKTFAVDGKRIETRLLIQHDLEDWVGYSYAWNEAGTDAELVVGNRVAPLAGGKTWYFPSAADCTACHTPAAGYTLGLEAQQLAPRGDALARLEASLEAPIDRATLPLLVSADAPPPATPEARARSYLHANCSMCHRQGSATGSVVNLDLRVDTPLAQTGLCREPQADAFGIANARILAPREPARSVILARMRVLDERRMPKLASRIVDEVGVAAVEAWIRELAACP